MSLRGKISIAGKTDIGLVREHNEDCIGVNEKYGLTVLADGMGGQKAGEVASSMAVGFVLTALVRGCRFGNWKKAVCRRDYRDYEQNLVRKAIEMANGKVFSAAQSNPDREGMGTTLVAGLHTRDSLVVGHLGDSRMYRYREGNLEQLTTDHSYVQELLDEGYLNEVEAENSEHRNVVTKALGVYPQVDVEVQEYEVQNGDIYLSCSDGLTDLVGDSDIRAIIMKYDRDLDGMADGLVETANAGGGRDNISVILSRIVRK